MKIVHVINYFQHQLGYQEFFLAREHARMGHDVTVLTSDRYFPFADYENTISPILGKRKIKRGTEKIHNFNVVRLPVLFEQKGVRILLRGLKKELSRIKPDIVITHGEYTFNTLLTVLYKKKNKYRLVIDCHSIRLDKKSRKGFFSKIRDLKSVIFKSIFIKFIWNRRDVKWVAVADKCAHLMVNECKFPQEEINIIPLGSDIDRFKPDPETRKKLRKVHGINEDDIVILYTGKINLDKDPALILESSKDLIQKYKLIYFFIGNIADDYRNRFEEIGGPLGACVKQINAVPNSELPQYYALADIAAWPKQASMSMIDAMASELPIIVCDYLTERLKNRNGIGIKEGNLIELRQAIQTLAEDPDLRNSMGKRGRELAERELDWKGISQKFIDLALQKD